MDLPPGSSQALLMEVPDVFKCGSSRRDREQLFKPLPPLTFLAGVAGRSQRALGEQLCLFPQALQPRSVVSNSRIVRRGGPLEFLQFCTQFGLIALIRLCRCIERFCSSVHPDFLDFWNYQGGGTSYYMSVNSAPPHVVLTVLWGIREGRQFFSQRTHLGGWSGCLRCRQMASVLQDIGSSSLGSL